MANSTIINLVLKAKDEASGILKGTMAKITAIGSALAAFGGAVAMREAVTKMTELDFAAKRLGISMADLTAAQYAAFQGANVGPQQFIDALDEVRIKIEEFSSIGSGGGVDFFEVMNTDVEKFNKLNPLEQIEQISKTLDGMSDSSAFTFLDQIGSDNLRNLLPILKNGGAEMSRLRQQAVDMGIILSDADTIGVAQLSKSFASLKSVGENVFDKLVASISPQLSAVADTIQETIVDLTRSSGDPAKSLGNAFNTALQSVLEFVDYAGKFKDMMDMTFGVIAGGLLHLVELFVTGLKTIDQGFVGLGNGLVNICRQAFSGAILLFNDIFVEPILEFTKAFNMDGPAEVLGRFQKDLLGMRNNSNKPIAVFKLENLDPALEGIRKVKESMLDMAKSNAAEVENSSLTKGLNEFGENYNKNVLKNEDARNKEVSRRAVASHEGTLAKLQTKNAAASAQIAATQAKLQADLAHKEIEITISKIETKKQIELDGLQERARLENMSAVKMADERFRIEMEAAKKLSEQKKKNLEVDITALQGSLGGQQKLLGATQNLNDRPNILAAINQLEADITSKQAEQATIAAELVNQQALLKSARAAEIGQIKEQLQQIKDDAQIELLAIGGDQFSADIKKIDADFKDTIKDMEALGDDSTAIQKLINAKKAQAEMAEIERQYGVLKSKLEKHEISPLDYLSKTNELEGRGEKAAAVTGNPADLDKVKESAKAARAEVFDLATLTDKVAESLQGGLEGLFTDFISGTKSAKDAFTEFAQGVLTEVSKIIAKLLIQLAIQSMLNAYTGGASAGAGGLMSMIGMKHSGGLIGGSGGMSRYGSMDIFSGAPKYHTGGEIGLKPNEVPIIAMKGEEMLTESDPRHRKNLNKGGSSTSNSQPRISIHNVLDAPSLAGAMEGAEGERMVMNHIRANRGEIKNL